MGGPAVLERTRKLNEAVLKLFGLTWDDVEDAILMQPTLYRFLIRRR
jgi:hypothetical protein